MATGGGILREESGMMVFVYYDFFGIRSSLPAEAQAVHI